MMLPQGVQDVTIGVMSISAYAVSIHGATPRQALEAARKCVRAGDPVQTIESIDLVIRTEMAKVDPWR